MNTPRKATLLTACLPAFIFLSAQTVMAQNTEIRILCSNGFHAAMEKLTPEYERSMGRSIKLQFGASAKLKQSIEAGEAFDLAILTPAIIEDLIKQGKIAHGSSVDLASSGIGMAVRAGAPKPDVSTAVAIKQTLLQAKSVGYVQSGASSPALVDMFNRLGIGGDVQRKTVFQTGAQESMANVANGTIEVAFGLSSEILPAPGVQLAGPVPPEFQKRILMTAGISSSTKNRAAADKIVTSLTSASAVGAIKASGLDPTEKEK